MGIANDAIQIIDTAEHELRKLISAGLDQQLYGDVARIARIAEVIASLQAEMGSRGNSSTGEQRPSSNEPIAATHSEEPASDSGQPPRGPRKSKRRTYPRFEKNGDKLVKVGWSKKNRREYEHKAPFDAILAFSQDLQHLINEQSTLSFVMEDLLPITTDEGTEVPDYQAYLTLAWLRELEVIKKDGRHSYKLLDPTWLSNNLEDAWSQLGAAT